MKYFLKIFVTLCLLCLATKTFALEQNSKEWFGFNMQRSLARNNKWHSFLFSQLRVLNNNNPWQAALVEAGLGYQATDSDTIWAGYRWTGRNLFNDFFEENRLFQQIIHQHRRKIFLFNLRTRLEELKPGNANQVGVKLRQRLSIESNIALWRKWYFYSYDEVFVRLNNADFLPRSVFNENRLFLGFNIRNSKTAWWEVGYINQFEVRTPQQSQNILSHIFSLTYNFIV